MNMERCAPLLALVITCLTACGGGGSSGGAAAPSVQTGVFGNPAVEGVRWETATQSGTTNANGEFRYLPGETVSFYLADVLLGSTAGTADVGFLSIAEPDVPQTAAQLSLYQEIRDIRNPLRRGLNIASLLYTLDTDQDPDNGIQIDARSAERFSAKGVDLGAAFGLHSSRHMREFLYESAAAGELSERPVYARALVAASQLPFEVDLYSAYEQDRNNDGTTDYAFTQAFDADGRTVRSDIDRDGDGEPDQRSELAWNANLERTLHRTDLDFDGTFDQQTEDAYDGFGSTIRTTTTDVSGVVTFQRDQTWDDNGALVLRRSVAPGSQTVERWLYTDGVRDTYERDGDGDGVYDRRDRFTFDARGNWITRDRDDGVDGTIDARYERTLNAFDQITRSAEDWDADGTWDSVQTSLYDDNGTLLDYRIESAGALISRTVYEYDADLLSAVLSDTDGSGDWNRTTRYDRDTDGRITRTTVDNDGDGNADYISEQIYDDQGRNTQTRVDDNADGETDEVTNRTFDEGRLITREVDRGNDGTVDSLDRYLDYVTRPVSAWF